MSTLTGRKAEDAAADYLRKNGYDVLAQNWRTRYCEIDIVARKNKIVYFVEVKYRAQASQGSGFDYITPKKLEQMTFAAEIWVQDNSWNGDHVLAAVEVAGPDFEILQMIEGWI